MFADEGAEDDYDDGNSAADRRSDRYMAAAVQLYAMRDHRDPIDHLQSVFLEVDAALKRIPGANTAPLDDLPMTDGIYPSTIERLFEAQMFGRRIKYNKADGHNAKTVKLMEAIPYVARFLTAVICARFPDHVTSATSQQHRRFTPDLFMAYSVQFTDSSIAAAVRDAIEPATAIGLAPAIADDESASTLDITASFTDLAN